MISSLQADALTREIERQLREESDAVMAAAQAEAQVVIAQARATARQKLRGTIAELRREGERRLTRAKAELDTAARAREQQQASRALEAAWPLLHEALVARWHDSEARKAWADSVAKLSAARLRRGDWTVEHPSDWTASEQADFTANLGDSDGIATTFTADPSISAGLRVKADQAVLDATMAGLLFDKRAIAALLLNELAQGSTKASAKGATHE
jgi:F0F1-type ATP synthase membrane subunit b/b'